MLREVQISLLVDREALSLVRLRHVHYIIPNFNAMSREKHMLWKCALVAPPIVP